SNAPVKVASVVAVSAVKSLVCTIHVPLPRLVPWFKFQPDGTSENVAVIRLFWLVAGFSSDRLIGCPATPAGTGGVLTPTCGESVPRKSLFIILLLPSRIVPVIAVIARAEVVSLIPSFGGWNVKANVVPTVLRLASYTATPAMFSDNVGAAPVKCIPLK